MSRTLERVSQFVRGDIVVVAPSDSDDPMAAEWRGRKCLVEIHARSYVHQYVRVIDVETDHRATFREKDVRRAV